MPIGFTPDALTKTCKNAMAIQRSLETFFLVNKAGIGIVDRSLYESETDFIETLSALAQQYDCVRAVNLDGISGRSRSFSIRGWSHPCASRPSWGPLDQDLVESEA